MNCGTLVLMSLSGRQEKGSSVRGASNVDRGSRFMVIISALNVARMWMSVVREKSLMVDVSGTGVYFFYIALVIFLYNM